MYNENTIALDFIAKVVVIGESGVGKTNILSRFCKNEFLLDTRSTIGVEFLSKIVEVKDKKIKLQIWDTAGQEKYKSITHSFYCNSNAAIIVFDLTSNDSFEKIEYWIEEVKKFARKDVVLMVLGNKSDLVREVTTEEGVIKTKLLSN